MTRHSFILFLSSLPAALSYAAAKEKLYKPNLSKFTPLFDGKSLAGWRKLTTFTGEDGKWEAVDGNIVGRQEPAGKGGLLVTEKEYSDYEVYAEVKGEYPIDSGFFLRTQPDAKSYQITLDYRPEGEMGAIYSHMGGGFLVHYPAGMDMWKKGEYNTVAARIEGQPPKIQAWINGVRVQNFTDALVDGKERVPRTGVFGIQVHEGAASGPDNRIFFRNIMIRELKK
jgi:hypothetical protein